VNLPNEKIRAVFIELLNQAAIVDMTDAETIGSILALAVLRGEQLSQLAAVELN
jgi:hypothetical protein